MVRDRVVPADVTLGQDLARTLDRSGEAISNAFGLLWVVEVHGDEIGDEDVVDGVGELVSLARVANLNQKLDSPLIFLRRLSRNDTFTERVGEHLEHLMRSEEHTSELQSLRHLVCRLLLEKKKKQKCHL